MHKHTANCLLIKVIVEDFKHVNDPLKEANSSCTGPHYKECKDAESP